MSSRDRDMAAVIGRLVAAFDGAILGLSFASLAAASWVKYFAASAAIDRINAAPSVPISGLRSLIASRDEEPILVVVRGHVQPRSAVVAHGRWSISKSDGVLIPRGCDERAVVTLYTQTVVNYTTSAECHVGALVSYLRRHLKCLYNEWRGMFPWTFDLHVLFARSWKERRSSSLRSVPFILVESDNSPDSGCVHVNLDGSAHPLPLTTVYHELHPVQATPYTFFQAMFGTGYPVALLDEEKILPVGKEITAIGICRHKDETIELKSCQDLPCFLSNMTKDEIVAELSSSSRILFWSGILLGALSAGVLGYALIRNLWRWKEWRLRRRRQIENLDNEAASRSSMEAEEVPDGELCVICLSTRRRSAFIPCGHLVCCPRCASQIVCDLSPKCPICRQNVRSSIRIYDS